MNKDYIELSIEHVDAKGKKHPLARTARSVSLSKLSELKAHPEMLASELMQQMFKEPEVHRHHEKP